MVNQLLSNTTPIIDIDNIDVHSLKELTELYDIRQQILTTWPNWFKIDNKWHYFKAIADEYYFLNELIGSELSKQFQLDTVNYSIAKLGNRYGILSENFRNKEYKYYDCRQLKMFNNNDNYENLYNLENLCLNKANYLKVLKNIFKLIGLDTYTGQWDRNSGNLYFYRYNNIMNLAPIFDYERSFNPEREQLYPWKYINCLCSITYDQKDIYKLFGDFPEFKQVFKLIMEIDIIQSIKNIENNYNLNISNGIKKHYSIYDHHKKQLIKKLI